MDDLKQYNRCENLKIYGIPESSNNKVNGENTILEIAEVLNIKLDDSDNQRTYSEQKKKITQP